MLVVVISMAVGGHAILTNIRVPSALNRRSNDRGATSVISNLFLFVRSSVSARLSTHGF
jgi:hypothetical protein